MDCGRGGGGAGCIGLTTPGSAGADTGAGGGGGRAFVCGIDSGDGLGAAFGAASTFDDWLADGE